MTRLHTWLSAKTKSPLTTMGRAVRLGVVFATLLATACNSNGSKSTLQSTNELEAGDTGPAKSLASEEAGVSITYAQDVASLLEEHCASCHQDGGIAPFTLTDYEAAAEWGPAIVEATASRQMPPMPVDNGGDCNTYANARWLEQEEIELLATWVEQGAPQGDRDVTVTAPRLQELTDADAILDPRVEYTPNDEQEDDYRCFVVDAPTDEDRFVTAYQVFPGDARVVHHVIVYQPTSAAEAELARQLDGEESGPGYTCFGSARIDAEPLALWAPGSGLTELPEDTGLPLRANRPLILQVHYNVENGVWPDHTTVGLRFADEPVIAGQYWGAADFDMRLAPGRELVETAHTESFPSPVSFKVHGALPHMHNLGRTLRVEADVDGALQCLVDVDRWDFHWQNTWWYDTPLALEDVSSLSIRCGFDTRSRSETVTWGDGTADEMCISYFYVTLDEEPRPEISCMNADNPVFGSCLEELLNGCYEPNVEAECGIADGVLTWPDGYSLVTMDEQAGFYGPDDEEPCIDLELTEEGAVLTRGDEQLTWTPSEENVQIQCPDGSVLEVEQFHMQEFSLCRGMLCIQ